jgi:hypothetical protein
MNEFSPIGGRASWTGHEMATDPSWIMALPPEAEREIAAALAALNGRDVPRFDARHFPLPRTAPFLRAVAEEFEHGRGLVRLTGQWGDVRAGAMPGKSAIAAWRASLQQQGEPRS